MIYECSIYDDDPDFRKIETFAKYTFEATMVNDNSSYVCTVNVDGKLNGGCSTETYVEIAWAGKYLDSPNRNADITYYIKRLLKFVADLLR